MRKTVRAPTGRHAAGKAIGDRRNLEVYKVSYVGDGKYDVRMRKK